MKSIANKITFLGTLSITAVVSLASVASAAPIMPTMPVTFPLQEFNLIVEENLTTTQEVEGKTFVGGDLNGTTFQPGFRVNGPASTVVLSVGGDLNVNNINLNRGSIVYGGANNTQNINNNSGGTVTQDPTVDVSSVYRDVEASSAAFAAETSNANFSQANNRLTFNANGQERSIFDISAETLFETQNQFIELVGADNATEVIINVTSDDGLVTANSSISFGGFIGFEAITLFNLPDVMELRLETNLRGSLLAPEAALSTITSIDGSVAVRSFTQNGEVHLPLSTVQPFAANEFVVPTPSSWLLILLAAPLMSRRMLNNAK